MTTENIIAFLEGVLPARLPAKKDRLCPEGTSCEVKVRPIPLRVKRMEVDKALAKTVPSDEIRTAMCGIYQCLNHHHKVTTNGHYLIVIPDTGIAVSKIVNPSTGQRIDETFPDYLSVIPFLDKVMLMDTPMEILNNLNGLCRASKFLTQPVRARFSIDGKHELFLDPFFLRTALAALVETGTTCIHVEVSTEVKTRPVIFRDAMDYGKFALVMPVMGSDFLFTTLIDGQTNRVALSKRIAHHKQQHQSALSEITFDMRYHHKALIADIQDNNSWGMDYHRKKIGQACLEQQDKINAIKEMILQLMAEQEATQVVASA